MSTKKTDSPINNETEDNNLKEFDSISKRLKYIVDTMGVKQSHMAEKLNLSPSGLHYILNNDVKFSKNAKKIAEYLNVNERWLTTGQGSIYEENTSIKTYKIPVYYPDQLKLFYRLQKKNQLHTNDFMLSTLEYPNTAIGFYITDNSFAPKFEVSDMLTFEQTEDFQDGEILLIYLAKSNDIVLKYAFKYGNDVILISYTEKPTKLSPASGDSIIGAYRECLKRSRTI